jgi:hypothetical protein
MDLKYQVDHLHNQLVFDAWVRMASLHLKMSESDAVVFASAGLMWLILRQLLTTKTSQQNDMNLLEPAK